MTFADRVLLSDAMRPSVIDRSARVEIACIVCGKPKAATLANRAKAARRPCRSCARSSGCEIGDRFFRLVIIGFGEPDGRGRKMADCLCDCGNRKLCAVDQLATPERHGVKSCGCLNREKRETTARTHGATSGRTKSATFKTWTGLIQRCTNPNNKSFKNYGARGITVCARWLESFEGFLADMGERPEGMTIEREDNEKGYSPENCKWATLSEQSRNMRTTRLDPERVREIRRRRSAGESCGAIALSMGVSKSLIKGVARGEQWKDVQ